MTHLRTPTHTTHTHVGEYLREGGREREGEGGEGGEREGREQ